MTKRIEVDSWLADQESCEIEISGKVFRCRPVTFNQALQVFSLIASMSPEYLRIVAEGRGEHDLVSDRETNLLIAALLSKIEFAGPIPDWIQRRRLAGLIRHKPITVRLLTIKEISDHFIEYLRQSLAPLAERLPEVTQAN